MYPGVQFSWTIIAGTWQHSYQIFYLLISVLLKQHNHNSEHILLLGVLCFFPNPTGSNCTHVSVGSQNQSGFWIRCYKDFRKCESRFVRCKTYHLGQECRVSTTGQLFATRSRLPEVRRLSRELQGQRFGASHRKLSQVDPVKLADSNDPTTRDFPKNEQYILQKMMKGVFSWTEATNVVTTLGDSL
jgi:hypothetical protein